MLKHIYKQICIYIQTIMYIIYTIDTYIYTLVYTYVQAYIYVYRNIHIYCTHAHTYVYLYIHMYKHIYSYMHTNKQCTSLMMMQHINNIISSMHIINDVATTSSIYNKHMHINKTSGQ